MLHLIIVIIDIVLHYLPHIFLVSLLYKTFSFLEHIRYRKTLLVLQFLCLTLFDYMINTFYPIITAPSKAWGMRIGLILAYIISAYLFSIFLYDGWWEYKFLLIIMWWFFYEVNRSIIFAGFFLLRYKINFSHEMELIAVINHLSLALITMILWKAHINSQIRISRGYCIILGIISFLAAEFIVTFDSDLNYLRSINTLEREIAVWFFLMLVVSVMYLGFSLQLRQLERIQTEKNQNYLYKLELDSAQTLFQESRRILHDTKNQLSVLASLMASKDISDAKHFFQSYLAANEKALTKLNTGNTTVDAMLHREQLKADQWNIPLTIDAILPARLSLNMADLSAVLFNALDNALEASLFVTCPQVSIQMKKWQNYVLINVTNNIDIDVLTENPTLKTTKPDKNNHGNGMFILRQITEKYEGEMTYKQEKRRFCVSVMLKDEEVKENYGSRYLRK